MLHLEPKAATAIAEALQENAKPENRTYAYKFYKDNCSTRILKLLDEHLGGVITMQNQGVSGNTNRAHTLRMLADDPLLYWALDFGLGPNVDRVNTAIDDLFLPQKLREGLARVQLTTVPSIHLVTKEKVWYQAKERTPVSATPPRRFHWYLASGCAFGLVITTLGSRGRRFGPENWAWKGAVYLLAAFGFFVGLLGCLLLYLSWFSDHEVCFYNANLMQVAPWAIAIPWFVRGWLRYPELQVKVVLRQIAAGMLLSVAGLLAYALGLSSQENLGIIALFLPMWVGTYVAATFLQRFPRGGH